MRRLVLAVCVALLPGCKGMGGLASGLGHVASGVGHVANAVGHVAAPVASGVAHVAAPVAKGMGQVAKGVAKASPVILQAAETTLEGLSAVEVDPPVPDFTEPVEHDPTTDLCLDCPDAGNCNSCVEPPIAQ